MENTGQSCNAPTRMLVPVARYDEALEIAQEVAKSIVTDMPDLEETQIEAEEAENIDREKFLQAILTELFIEHPVLAVPDVITDPQPVAEKGPTEGLRNRQRTASKQLRDPCQQPSRWRKPP